MKSLGFHHVAVQARDVERVAAFYRDVLGLAELTRHLRDDGSLRSVWLSVSGEADASRGFIAVEANEGEGRGPLGFSMFALRIEPGERARIEAELQRRGVPIEKQTGWTLYVRDPEGNLVGLSHHPHPRA